MSRACLRPPPRRVWLAAVGLHHHKLEGGQGGRRGHSNMDHWLTTAEIKDVTRGERRRAGKAVIARELRERAHEPPKEADRRG